MNLDEFFRPSLSGRARKQALVTADGAGRETPWTFGDIDARANRVASWLVGQGFSRGDRICVYLPNRIEFLDLFLAATRLGLIFVPMNVLYREREARHIVGDAEPKAVVTTADAIANLPAGTATIDVEEITRVAARGATLPIIEGPSDVDPTLIIYTSGTTGTAKGAVLTHANLIANASTLTSAWKISD
ncbi:MAG TPA: AMP-binding protein, partial [Gemmatimonadaceae bacterium]